jgi:uncharacterized membrane protein YdjX (TVP38/TMEM64 family)
MQRKDLGRLTLIVVAVVVVAAIAILLWRAPQTRHYALLAIKEIHRLGDWGPVVFAICYAIGVVTLVPSAPMTLIAGIAFGVKAVPLVIIAAMIGALTSFVIARFVLRERLLRYIERGSKFHDVDKAIASEGWKIVALLRLSPLVPFNLQNYLIGATRIGFWPYVTSTFVGIIPGTLVFIYIGSVFGKAALSAKHVGPLQWTLLVVGFAATIWVSWIVHQRASQALSRRGFSRKRLSSTV